MRILKLGIVASACAAVSACATMPFAQELEGCYALEGLTPMQRWSLDVGTANPILVAGGQQIVCSCYRDSELAGAGESTQLAGADESGRLAGAGEGGRLAGDDETGRLAGDDEAGRLAGDDEAGRLAGAGEGGRLAGADESGRLAGADEGGRLAGAGESGRLGGDFADLSCRIAPECSGYQLTGYEPAEIMVLTVNGMTPTPTSCITW